MLKIQDIVYRIGGRVILDGASFQLPDGHRAGLVGRNGCGKSTLFSLLLKKNHADSGEIELSRGFKIITVAQEVPGGEQTPIDYLLASDIERHQLMHELEMCIDPNAMSDIYERLIQIDAYSAESRAAIVLKGLGFNEEEQLRPLSSFSGGYRMRVALAAALYQTPDLLLLDEPTNHLDIESIIWLKEFLKSYPNSLLLISHDRDMLNTCVNSILHLREGKITPYSGNYDFFEKTFEQQQMFNASYNVKLQAQRQHLQNFVDRFRAVASKARQAQSRLKAIEKLGPMMSLVEDPSIRMTFPEVEPLSPPIIHFEKVSLGYGDHVVLRNVHGSIQPTDRIAILGANGNGKSTFAKFIAGRLQPLSGEYEKSGKLRIGYFHQHQHEELDLHQSAYHMMQALMPSAPEPKVRGHLGRFGFSRDKADVKIGSLSGGEKARLMFATISLSQPHILILDEPTNHLDMDMRESLTLAINEFEGAVILIAHDWHLLKHTVDQLWVVAEGTVKPFERSIDDYRQFVTGGKMGGQKNNNKNNKGADKKGKKNR